MSTENITEHKIIRAIPLDENCFATNDGPSEGVGLHVYVTEDEHIVGMCKTKQCHQGYADTVHGGIIMTYFDEVLWYATTLIGSDVMAMTVEMNVKFLKSLHTGQNIRIIAQPMRQEGRHIYVDGYILGEDDQVAAKATAHFIAVKSDHKLNDSGFYETLQVDDAYMPESVRF